MKLREAEGGNLILLNVLPEFTGYVAADITDHFLKDAKNHLTVDRLSMTSMMSVLSGAAGNGSLVPSTADWIIPLLPGRTLSQCLKPNNHVQ